MIFKALRFNPFVEASVSKHAPHLCISGVNFKTYTLLQSKLPFRGWEEILEEVKRQKTVPFQTKVIGSAFGQGRRLPTGHQGAIGD